MNINNYLSKEQVIDILNNYLPSKEIIHCQKVANFSMILANSLSSSLNISQEDVALLYYSGLLHDIGRSIRKEEHHKYSKYIILTHDAFSNLPYDLRFNLASICYSHRKVLDEDIFYYCDKNKEIILKLICLLRIADSLDHSHKYNIALNKVEMTNNTLFLFLQGLDVKNIIKRLSRKSELFAEIFNVKIKIEI